MVNESTIEGDKMELLIAMVLALFLIFGISVVSGILSIAKELRGLNNHLRIISENIYYGFEKIMVNRGIKGDDKEFILKIVTGIYKFIIENRRTE